VRSFYRELAVLLSLVRSRIMIILYDVLVWIDNEAATTLPRSLLARGASVRSDTFHASL
jgi:hypothetical protein